MTILNAKTFGLSTALVTALALTACGPGNTPAETADTSPPEATTPETTAAQTENQASSTNAPADVKQTEAEAAPASQDIKPQERQESTPTAAPAGPDLSALPAPYHEADYANGKRQFNKCKACHTLVAGGPDRVGPNLHGVFDREVGAKAGFNYSEAVKTADFQWTPEKLDQWLENPRGFLPGNRMSFAGIKKADDRRDLIAYLLVESGK